ncbi:MAG TPA: SDR family oxidoreductase [Burkholderiales bacterium]
MIRRVLPEGSSVLVTGGSSGIGWSICQRLREDGWDVVSFDLQPPPVSGVCEHERVDMGDEAALDGALARLINRKAVLGLVNNVAAIEPASLEETTLSSFDRQLRVTTRAALQCAKAVVPAMRKAGFGRIVNISSRAALGKELRSAYAASKGALNSLTRTWALELAGVGITVNAVAPGPIATEAFKRANPPDSPRTARILQGVPMGRYGEPEEVAHAVAFFMDPRSSFITGQILYVCGGITVGLAS